MFPSHDKHKESVEAILCDGHLSVGEEIAVASFNEPIVSKVRALEEIIPLSDKYKSVEEAFAATGIRIHLTNKEDILPGMLFQEVKGNLDEITKNFKKELAGALELDKKGIIVKADSLGSLEALMTLLKQEGIQIIKAGIGPIGKSDMVSAKTNLEINPLDAIILGFNVNLEEEVS